MKKKLLYLVLFFLLISKNLYANESYKDITLTWVNSPSNSMTVTWKTSSNIQTGFIKYGMYNNLNNQIKVNFHKFNTNLNTYNVFSTTLTNLLPNTQYSYAVGDGLSWSSNYKFKTMPINPNKFKFLVFSDSQDKVEGVSPYLDWANTIQSAYKLNRDADFIVCVGDLVDVGDDELHWNAWFKGAQNIISNLPIIPVVGNHEVVGINKYVGKPKFFLANFKLPQNGPSNIKGQAYFYNLGNTDIIVLDSQYEEYNELKSTENLLNEQAQWLDEILSKSDSTYKIVFMHKNPYPLLPKRDNNLVKNILCPVIEKYNVNIVFTGHDHGVARTYPIKNGEIAKKGTIYYTCGRSGKKAYFNILKREWNDFFYNPLEQPNYLVVEVDNFKLNVKAFKQNGQIIDNFILKPNH